MIKPIGKVRNESSIEFCRECDDNGAKYLYVIEEKNDKGVNYLVCAECIVDSMLEIAEEG